MYNETIEVLFIYFNRVFSVKISLFSVIYNEDGLDVVLLSVDDNLKYALKTKNKKIINQAFEEIYYEYGHLIGFIISQYVKNYSDVEELINDVFLNFFNNLDKIKIKNIKAYLTKIAKNKAIDYLIENKNKYLLDNELVLTTGEADRSLYSIIIKDMKRLLTDEEIEIIIEHAIYDVSFKALAKKYNKPISTLSTKYYQAIQKYKAGDNHVK